MRWPKTFVYRPNQFCYKRTSSKTLSEGSSSLDITAKPSVVTPVPAFHNQDVVFRHALELLQHAVADHAFPAASLAVTHCGKLVALKSVGRFTYEPDSPEVTPASIFDLASVSKVIATTSMAMILYERGLLDLEAPVTGIVSEFAASDSRKAEITVRMILAHSSGLPAYEKLFLRAKNRQELLAAAFATPLTSDPGTRTEYSDIGFIILGSVLEHIADEPLDRFCQREVFRPLGMANTMFKRSASWRASIVPTADDRSSRRRVIQGEVQDENASVLGGVAGHAGLFSTAQDIAIFAQAILNGGGPIFRPETLAQFTRSESSPAGTSRALGWDTPSTPSQSGKYFSSRSFGHLGYTGTSLWVDPARELSVTLLTNRTWPDCKKESIKEVRPRVHDAIIEALEKSA
jgi:CubicO group peptidase (beta-lactamase class C family)